MPPSNYSTVEFDTAGWTFTSKKTSPPSSLAFLPILALILFGVCFLLKVYTWYKEYAKWKARGEDMEYSEINYGIIRAGDKEFCSVEIRSDTTSVYDTVNSFRLMGNGYATQVHGAHCYHDTVTSYKSLLMQRLDGGHYDSVKSYKAFLKQVTQNTDLAVEVKLLENYPVKSKSVEHCMVVEEESSERSPDVTKTLLTSQGDGRKRARGRRASGENEQQLRKPVYTRGKNSTTSLPSIRPSFSSDSSDEDHSKSLATDKKKMWAKRKKMSRSCSGGKIAKASPIHVHRESDRRRHLSADSARHPRRPLYACGHVKSSSGFHRPGLKDLRESISETDPKVDERVNVKRMSESSSDNPDSSPSSQNSSIASSVASESEEETRHNTMVSVASDLTAENEVVFDSGAEFASSAEVLTSPRRLPLTSEMVANELSEPEVKVEMYISETELENDDSQIGSIYSLPSHSYHSVTNLPRQRILSHANTRDESWSSLPVHLSPEPSSSMFSISSSGMSRVSSLVNDQDDSAGGSRPKDGNTSYENNSKQVQRFHVTSVPAADVSTGASD